MLLVRVLLMWDTYRFVLATALFGLLVPVHLIGQLLTRACAPRSKRAVAPQSTCMFWMGGAIWVGLLTFSLLLVYSICPSAIGADGTLVDGYEVRARMAHGAWRVGLEV